MDMKKGRNVVILVESLVTPKPLVGFKEKAVRTQEVIVSGIFLLQVNSLASVLFFVQGLVKVLFPITGNYLLFNIGE